MGGELLVADKRRVRQTMKTLQRIKTWQLIILFILACFVTATFLRLNNIGMVERRTAVISADAAGDSNVTANRLYDLQRYVTAHMNTDMGKGVYLQNQYNRDSKKILDAASASEDTNGNVYKKAEAVCRARYPDYAHGTYAAYQQCFLDQVSSYAPGSDLASTIVLPRADQYLHVYVSPAWSPDFAGWSLVVSLVILVLIIVRLVSLGVLRLLLRRHYKSI